jgi:SAM-dependent methyltransferase
VQPRTKTFVPVTLYPGDRLPFADRAFDLSYAVDVLHHCPQPRDSLKELARCTRRWLLLKDHTYRSFAGWWTLACLDELGNRRFGIPSPYRYMRNWEWFDVLTDAGFELRQRIHPAAVHPGGLGWATNHLQFVAVWERIDQARAAAE